LKKENLGPLTAVTFPLYVNVLAGRYSELQAIVDQWGVPRFWARAPGFETLFLIILQQQISLPVARVIHRRIKDSLGGVSARRVLEAGQERLHALGLTKQKSRYCCELAAAVKKKRFSIEGLQKLDDSAAILLLRAQLGIGPWSSAIYLMSALKRLDVWPPGDLALRRGVEKLFPGEDVKDLSDTGAQWAPYRAIAARLIWHFYNCTFSSKRQKA
jgi:DNA-3-methyladenine glycosylase II